MSKFTEEKVKCPKCSEEIIFTVWESANFTLSPELKANILNNTFFLATCLKCGDAHNIIYPCLFHDMEKSYMIWLIPDGDKKDLKALNLTWIGLESEAKFTRLGELTEDLKYENLRCVFNPIDLKEKICINDSNLDDRVIEILKVLILASMIQNNKQEGINFNTILLFSSLSLSAAEKNIVFTIKGKDTISSFTVSYDLYEDTLKNYADLIPSKKKEYAVIDRKWALNALGE